MSDEKTNAARMEALLQEARRQKHNAWAAREKRAETAGREWLNGLGFDFPEQDRPEWDFGDYFICIMAGGETEASYEVSVHEKDGNRPLAGPGAYLGKFLNVRQLSGTEFALAVEVKITTLQWKQELKSKGAE